MKSQQSGFTLVEIAIVLVIIGLLLGGILKGQELINSAQGEEPRERLPHHPDLHLRLSGQVQGAARRRRAGASTHVPGCNAGHPRRSQGNGVIERPLECQLRRTDESASSGSTFAWRTWPRAHRLHRTPPYRPDATRRGASHQRPQQRRRLRAHDHRR
ncbi:MAG: prepilin-type N-terminal cleavage/methylation domain-containing protein [Comamonadaceae bacterium]|nr:prepilin-type N-terminal cleavage/methylation domain-containing protein [Comamonadaceae bacterium]